MSVAPRLDAMRHRAARRQAAVAFTCAAPLALALVVFALRVGGLAPGMVVALSAAIALLLLSWRAVRTVDQAWLARRLDALAPEMDDSAALLFRDAGALSHLQRLQQARLRTRIAAINTDTRSAWPWRVMGACFGIALAVLVAASLWPATERSDVDAATSVSAVQAGAVRAVRTELTIEPPAYTGLASRSETTLDAKVPQDARLHWRLRFDRAPRAAALVFHDGSRLELRHDGADWTGERVLPASALYRIALEGGLPLADDRLHRLDAILDQAPEVRVIQPDKTLSLLDAGQKTWSVEFEASDDYTIAHAELSLTLAQGGGENIEVKEQTVALTAEPLATQGGTASQPALIPPLASQGVSPSRAVRERDGRAPRVAVRYAHVLDLAALGVSTGDDVIVRVLVTDNREPQANTTRSASFILRWPVEVSSDSAGLEGIVQRTLPAYFRSQRQIIIDSEALLAERPQLDEAKFMARSDALGVDQRILRLRYGQFLGEESETPAARHAADQHADGDAGDEHAGDAHDESGDAQEAPASHAHAGAQTSAPAKFGDAGDVVAEYGHVHDIAEAATLLDPETKAILKSALSEMWQAELHLRQGDPAQALPYEYRALEFVKQVQQSTRIYLARVGLELPLPDETRRLSGKRDDLTDRIGTLASAPADDATLSRMWQVLAGDDIPDWDAAQAFVAARQATLPDALGVLAAIDAARRDPACADCRARLRGLLWPLLPSPVAASALRGAPDDAGRAYLDALRSATDPAVAR